MYWLDYSAGTLSGATIRADGYGGVIRYTTAPALMNPANGLKKHTTKAEYDDHIRNGLTVRLAYQGDTHDADLGWAGGVQNGQRALAGANYLGYTGLIFFTNDRTTLPNPAAWQSYLDGAASVLGRGRVGAYGFRNAIDAAQGHATAFWQAGSRSLLSPKANYWQDNNTQVTVGGITCDRNLVIAQEGNDVPLTDQDVYKIWRDALLTRDPAGHPGVTINAANVLDTLLNSDQAQTAKLDALAAKVADIQGKVTTPVPVDLDALAAKVAALIGPALAKAVADEEYRRMEN